MREIDGQTKILGLIGDPIEHTYSPQIHNFLSEKYGLNYAYLPFFVKKGEAGRAADAIRALNLAGINVTAPHKIEIMKYLDEISESAKKMGSVNTVKNIGGKLIGYNTDADGFCALLSENGMKVSGSDILIFGAGGAARPICVKFADGGAKSITVVNRTAERTEELKRFVSDACGYTINTKIDEKTYDIIINTTSMGIFPNEDASPVSDYSFIGENSGVCDMIYNPPETKFLRDAKRFGAKLCVNGLEMLIFQAIFAYEIFADIKIDISICREIKRKVFGI